MQYPVSLSIKPHPSRFLLISGGIVHVLACAAVMVSGILWLFKAGLIGGIACSLARFAHRYACRCGRELIASVELLDGRWRLEDGDGGIRRAVLTGSYAHPLIIILNFQIESGGCRSLTLLPDSADPDEMRRLRVWLRTQPDGEGLTPP